MVGSGKIKHIASIRRTGGHIFGATGKGQLVAPEFDVSANFEWCNIYTLTIDESTISAVEVAQIDGTALLNDLRMLPAY